MSIYETMSDRELQKLYVPDVYQPDVYAIDYYRLKSAGIVLISFDVDDTIAKMEEFLPPEKTITLFKKLKKMEFKLVLMSNNRSEVRADVFSSELGVNYISDAEKPRSVGFRDCQNLYFFRYHTKLNLRTDGM